MLNSKIYDVLKWLCVIGVPAIIVFLNTCLPVWGVPADVANVIVTTISAIGTLIGSLIAVSTATYNKNSKEQDKDANN